MTDKRGAPGQTPGHIKVWVCPKCGYWREDKSSGVHQAFQDHGPAERHPLVECVYIFEHTTRKVGK